MFDRGHERGYLRPGANNNCVTVEMVILIHHGDWKRAVQNQLQTSEMVTITGGSSRALVALWLFNDPVERSRNECSASLLPENFSRS